MRAALTIARTMAAVARRDPSDDNLQAARAAIAAVAHRYDWRTDQVGVSVSGHGYNPYRDKGGKFAPGVRKPRRKGDERRMAAVAAAKERVSKAKATVEKHAEKLSAAHEARRGAIEETRSALGKARAAAEFARAKPTAKNVRAAQVATNKATRAGAKIGKHDAAIAKHTEAHAKATMAHAKAVEAHATANAKAEGGKRTDGSGYNPYRAGDGKFAPGAHKGRPSVGHEHAAKSHEPRAAFAKAKAAAETARTKPTKANIAAAKQATGEAARAARVPKTKEQQIDRAFQYAAAGEHAKAQALFAKHGVAVPENVRQLGARAGFDYRAAPAAGTAAATHAAAAKATHTADLTGADAHVSGVAADHVAAAAAHERAAVVHREVGNHVQAAEHERQADEHRRAAEEIGRPAPQPPAPVPHIERTPHDEAFAARDAIRGRIASGIHGDAEHADIDPAAQAALRDANNRIMAAYGVTPRLTNTTDAHTVHTVTAEEMGGAYGQMWSEHTNRPGLMTISHEQAVLLREHMQLDSDGRHRLAQRAAAGHDDAYFQLFAAHTMHHETMHGHGPSIEMGLHRSTVEELTTEMSARRITADMHGVPSHSEAVNLAYDHIIDPVVAHTANATGVSRERAYQAVEHASLSLKRSHGTLTDDEAIAHVATKAAEHLGAPDAAGKIATGIYQTSNKLRMGP